MAANPRGVYAAILTPFNANLEPDLGAFVNHARWLLANGCDGLEPSEDGLFAFFAAVIERVADRRLRLYLYHFPQLSTVPMTSSLIRRLQREFGDTIAGLKDSGGDWGYSAALLKEFPGFAVFSGSEQYLLDNLRAGGVGTISASVNVTAPLAHPVFRHWRTPKAESLQARLTAVRVLFQHYPLISGLKETLALISGNAAWRAMLPPNVPLGAADAAALKAQLAELPAMQPVIAAARAA